MYRVFFKLILYVFTVTTELSVQSLHEQSTKVIVPWYDVESFLVRKLKSCTEYLYHEYSCCYCTAR